MKQIPNVGDIVSLGYYEQGAIDTWSFRFVNEPIEWIVIDVNTTEAILLCCNGLEALSYDDGECFYRGWRKSSIREFLNGEFVRHAFSREQQELLIQTINKTVWRNPQNDSLNIDETEDLVYLLSSEEFKRYEHTFVRNGLMNLRACFFTDYSACGIGSSADACSWYLRDAVESGVAIVGEKELQSYRPDAYDGDYPCGVRPVIKINLNTGYDMYKEKGETLAKCDDAITHVEISDKGTTFIVGTDRSEYSASVSTMKWGNQIGCVGGYWACDKSINDLNMFIGATLKRVYLAETYLLIPPWENQKVHEALKNCLCESVLYINFETSRGIIQYVIYNYHSGNDEQDVTAKNRDTVLYEVQF